MKRLSDFEMNELVMKYSGECRPLQVRTAILHAQQILSEKNSEPKPKPHLPRGPRYEKGTEGSAHICDLVKAFFWGK